MPPRIEAGQDRQLVQADWQVEPQLSLVLRSSSGITGPDSMTLMSRSNRSSSVWVSPAAAGAIGVAVFMTWVPPCARWVGGHLARCAGQGQEIVTVVCRFGIRRASDSAATVAEAGKTLIRAGRPCRWSRSHTRICSTSVSARPAAAGPCA